MTAINPSIFRAYDIRGRYPDELNEEAAYSIGLAYGTLLKNAKKVAVSHDGRKGSLAIKGKLIEGLIGTGKNVVDIGLAPTPVLYFTICHIKLDGGISITGSHNPPEYTGLKLQKRNAGPITGEGGIYEMRDMIVEERLTEAKNKGRITERTIAENYIDYIASKTKLKKRLKIIIDSGNGSATDIPRRIFEKSGCEVISPFENLDTSYPNHMPDPHDYKNMKYLQQTVLKERADMGFAFDGDADRVGMVDNKGRIVDADRLLIMLARHALSKRKGDVVVEVRTSSTVINDIKKHGGSPVMTRSGHSYLLEEIMRRKAVFGGEVTGHMYFPEEYYPYDDGIFIATVLARIASSVPDFSEYVDSLPEAFASPEIEIPCADNEKFHKIESLIKILRKEGYDFLGIDGARISFEKGWCLIRASNTTPSIKCRAEGDSEKALREILSKLNELLGRIGLKAHL